MTTIRTAGKAYQAIAQLERKPKETVALLRKQLQPVPTASEKIITQQRRDLSSDNFAFGSKRMWLSKKLSNTRRIPFRKR